MNENFNIPSMTNHIEEDQANDNLNLLKKFNINFKNITITVNSEPIKLTDQQIEKIFNKSKMIGQGSFGCVNVFPCESPTTKKSTNIAAKKTEFSLGLLKNDSTAPQDQMETFALESIQNTKNCLKYYGSIYYDNYIYVFMEKMGSDIEQLKKRIFANMADIQNANKKADLFARKVKKNPIYRKMGLDLRQLLAKKFPTLKDQGIPGWLEAQRSGDIRMVRGSNLQNSRK